MFFMKPANCYFGIGRRKTSVAFVSLRPGIGLMKINKIQGELYLQSNPQYIGTCKSPLREIKACKIPLVAPVGSFINEDKILDLEPALDIHVRTSGGGLRSQAEAIKLGVARALDEIPHGVYWVSFDSRFNSRLFQRQLRQNGFLTRDARRKERKKYGLRKARRAPQFSKR